MPISHPLASDAETILLFEHLSRLMSQSLCCQSHSVTGDVKICILRDQSETESSQRSEDQASREFRDKYIRWRHFQAL